MHRPVHILCLVIVFCRARASAVAARATAAALKRRIGDLGARRDERLFLAQFAPALLDSDRNRRLALERDEDQTLASLQRELDEVNAQLGRSRQRRGAAGARDGDDDVADDRRIDEYVATTRSVALAPETHEDERAFIMSALRDDRRPSL